MSEQLRGTQGGSRIAAACVVVGVLLVAGGCASSDGVAAPPPPPTATSSATAETSPPESPAVESPTPDDGADGTALAAAQELTVKGRAPKTGYSRDSFGQRWADTDRSGCDQRNDVLRRDLDGFVTKPGTHGCVVLAGTLDDPYTGTTVDFIRGEGTSTAVQIDHVVALSDAWQKGAQQWSEEKRTQFANDFLNLLAVDGPTNGAKRDGDTATWLPPNKGYRCTYVARQVAVKSHYGVWVTRAEQDAMVRILTTCPDEPLPVHGDVTPPDPDPSTEGTPDTASPSSGTPRPSADSDDEVTYANCTEVKEAGKAPIREGDPGYGPHLDRDGDGIACE